ncbi:hypothetical protein KSF78_0007656 [Schistosoma japonicum]|nr:hypothetical protein KSF78_0007656 [Schistosoma japonicum]
MNRMKLCLLFVSLVLISMQVFVQSTYTSRNNLHLSYSFDSSLKYDIVLQDLMEWQVTRLHYELPPDWMCPSCNCDKTAVM